ncbi:MAG TPA: Ig-like domain-containing protein, partial [Abditibacteriaceae bacterium]
MKRMFSKTAQKTIAPMFVLVAGGLLMAPAHAQTNLLQNGSFETGNFSGWNVTNPSPNNNGVMNEPSGFPASNGTRKVILNSGNLVGSLKISQSFPTIVGKKYTVSFDYGVNPIARVQRISVGFTGNLDQTISSDPGGSPLVYTAKSVTFTATATSSTLSLQDVTTFDEGNNADGFLDNVQVLQDANSTPVAVNTVVNGNFETGTLAGWTNAGRKEYSGEWYSYSGTRSPVSNYLIAAPPEGAYAAVADQNGPTNQILYQDVFLEAGKQHVLSFSLYYENRAGVFYTPASLSPSGIANQQYRVDIVKPTAPADSVASSDVLLNVFRTNSGDPNSKAPTVYTTDLTQFAGQTVRLRFASVQTSFFMQASVDDVKFVTASTNRAPVATDDTASTNEDTAATIDAKANDTDADGDALTITVGTVTGGTATVVDGKIVFTPTADSNATGTVNYTVSDGKGGSDEGEVKITVNSVNDAPVAVDDATSTEEEAGVNIDAAANDTDIDNKTLTVTDVSVPAAQGVASINTTNGTIDFAPAKDFNGVATITYTISDGKLTDTGELKVTVTPVNDASVANAQLVDTDEDTAKKITLTGSDIDGDTLVFVILSQPKNGKLTGAGAEWTYTPNANFNGKDDFTFSVNDSEVATV